MNQELTRDARQREIETRLESALETAESEALRPGRRAVLEREDRWYGQILALVSNSLSETPDDDATLQAATGIELLRGYCHLREQTLTGPAADTDDPRVGQRDASLLAADYLHSMAYTMISSLETSGSPTRIAALTDVSETLVESFDRAEFGPDLTAPAYRSLVDGTAGALGRGAAVLGAILGTTDNVRREQFGRAGRQFSTGRRLRRDRTTTAELAPSQPDRQLREHERQRFIAGMRTLRELPQSVDTDSLRSFFRTVLPEIEMTE